MPEQYPRHQENVAEHTQSARDLAIRQDLLRVDDEGYMVFIDPTDKNRRDIGRDTFPIEDHVDIRTWGAGGEAIVVDSTREQEGYYKLVNDFRAEMQAKPSPWTTRDTLQGIYGSVVNRMTYDLDATEKIYNNAGKTTAQRKVNLGAFMDEGLGVCRHMALAASWLGGSLVKEGVLPKTGRLTAEVNQHDEIGAHAWGRYEDPADPDGEVYIIDPAQKFFGTLRDAMYGNRWDYFRPGERQKLEVKYFAGPVVTEHTTELSLERQNQQVLDARREDFFKAFSNVSNIFNDPEHPENAEQPDETMQPTVDTLLRTGLALWQDYANGNPDKMKAIEDFADNMAEDLKTLHYFVMRHYPKDILVGSAEQRGWIESVVDSYGRINTAGANGPDYPFRKHVVATGLQNLKTMMLQLDVAGSSFAEQVRGAA